MTSRVIAKRLSDLPTYGLGYNTGALLYSEDGSNYQIPMTNFLTASKSFDVGFTITSIKEEIVYGGQRLVWTGSYPKTVPSGSTPDTTGGIGSGAWAYSNDSVLRENLRSSEEGLGAGLITTTVTNFLGGTQGNSVQAELDNVIHKTELDMISFFKFITPTQYDDIKNGSLQLGMSVLLETACKTAYLQNKQLYVPAGHYLIDAQFDHYGCIIGAGEGRTVFHIKAGAGGMMSYGSLYYPGTKPANCVLRDFTITGVEGNFFAYDSTNTSTYYNASTVGTEGAIRAEYFENVSITNVSVLWCRGFSIVAGSNLSAEIKNCTIKNSMRDGIRVGGNHSTVVSGNYIEHCGDNAIAAGTDYKSNLVGYTQTLNRGCVITDNVLIDTCGIACLGGTYTNISNNILNRTKYLGIMVGWSGGTEGANDMAAINIKDNLISDMIPAPAVFAAGGSNVPSQGSDSLWNVGILISPYPQVAVTNSVPPGQFDYALHSFVLPETYFLASAGNTTKTSPIFGIRDIRISGNQFTRTLPDANLYSSWGLGKVFCPTGWVDPIMSTMRTGTGILARVGQYTPTPAIHRLVAKDNLFYGLDKGINLKYCTFINNLVIKDNEFIRLGTSGVDVSGGNFASSSKLGQPYGFLNVSDNVFDIDPYLESSYRTSGGGWNNTDVPAGVSRSYVTGIIAKNNIFRNCAIGVSDVGGMRNNTGAETTRGTGVVKNNIYLCQPADGYDFTVAGSTNNKGVRYIPKMTSDDFIVEDSDPTSATYLTTKYASGMSATSSVPTTGYWPAGYFAKNLDKAIKTQTITVGSNTLTHTYVIAGWYRLTSGSSNTLGTDWVEARSTISLA